VAEIVILGASDMARLAHYYFATDSEHEVAAFTVDDEYLTGDEFRGLPLVPFSRLPERYPPSRFGLFVAIGYTRMNQARASHYAAAKELGYTLATYVSSQCAYQAELPPGDNCLILDGTLVDPGVRLGSDIIVWRGAYIGHDSVIEDHCFVSPCASVASHVRVGSHCFLGIGSVVQNGISLGERTLVGAGAVIAEDTEPGSAHAAPRAVKLNRGSDEVHLR
jgi:sugar O-acyltransferase (sialic acid O-acetyltransferase NeuD family)